MKLQHLLLFALLIFLHPSPLLALDTKEANRIWPYDEKVLAVRNTTEVTKVENREEMSAEFLVKDHDKNCAAYPSKLSRPIGSSDWKVDAMDTSYAISCSNYKRLREASKESSKSKLRESHKRNDNSSTAEDAADKTIDRTEKNIDRVERVEKIYDWTKKF